MKQKIYNNLLGHIVGFTDDNLNIFIKKLLSINKNINIINLDDITYEIINTNKMKSLYKKKIKLDKNEKKLIEKKINILWKEMMESKINSILLDSDKLFICVGYCNYFDNIKTFIKLFTPNKFFLKLDYLQNAKNIIEYNLDNNKNEIINGTFCLNYLNIDFLINKRKQFECEYKKMNYIIYSFDKILITFILEIKLHQYDLKPDILFWPDINDNDNIIAYSDLWLAITSQFRSNIEKGYIDNKPYIQGKDLNKLFNKPIKILYTNSTYKFIPNVTKTNRLYKYIMNEKILNKEIKILNIENIYNYFKTNNINLIEQ